jgi:hypothetical protein
VKLHTDESYYVTYVTTTLVVSVVAAIRLQIADIPIWTLLLGACQPIVDTVVHGQTHHTHSSD